MTALQLASGFGALALATGLFMGARIFQKKGLPNSVAIAHFVFTVATLGVIADFVARGPAGASAAGVYRAGWILGAAALGGFWITSYRLSEKFPSKWVVIAHGLAGAAGILVLTLGLI